MPNDTWYNHNMQNIRSVMTTCVGTKHGINSEDKIDQIRESRYRYGKKVCRTLQVNDQDTVLDIGSGCGFVTRAACEIAKQVHCLDITQDFLDFTQNELSEFPNTHFNKIDYRTFIGIPDNHADKAFSTAVFIHFNYYDILFYLIEINRVLKENGMLYLEFIDADTLNLHTMAGIKKNIAAYSNSDRGDAQLMHPHSLTGFKHLATQLGFELVTVNHSADVAEVVLQKIKKPDLPDWLEHKVIHDQSNLEDFGHNHSEVQSQH